MKAAEEKFQKVNKTSVGGGEVYDFLRASRRQNQLTQYKPRFVNEIPMGNVGKEGDILYYQNPSNLNKVEQYVKQNGEWINLSIGRPISDSAKVKKFIKAKTNS